MIRLLSLSLLLALGLFGCGQEADESTQFRPVSPEQTELRFHVSFNKFLSNNLDIHVVEPGGDHLSFANPRSDSGGRLDQDCSCGECPSEGSESILWHSNQAGTGLYEIWVELEGNCSANVESSEFTLSVLEGHEVKAALKGRLSQGQSQVLYYEFSRDN